MKKNPFKAHPAGKTGKYYAVPIFTTQLVHCLSQCSKRDKCGYARPPCSTIHTYDSSIIMDGCINYTEEYVTR